MKVDELRNRFPNRQVRELARVDDIPPEAYCVYILTIDEQAVVVGHGRKNRARVIFDDRDTITPNHIKAMIVRLYTLYGPASAVKGRFLIKCESKAEANELEKQIQRAHGGNTLNVPDFISDELLNGLPESSPIRMVLRMALCSSFDGINDLKRWRREGILGDELWNPIVERLQLPHA